MQHCAETDSEIRSSQIVGYYFHYSVDPETSLHITLWIEI